MLNCFGVASTANIGADCALIIVMFLLTLVTLATAVWLLAKFINEEKGRNTVKYAAIVVAAGVAIRLLCAVFVGGDRNDFIDYNTAIDYFVNNGVFYYYYKVGVKIYPLSFYMLALFGGLGHAFGLASGSAWLTLLVKIPYIAADAFTAVILYRMGKRHVNSEVGTVLAAVYSLCPVFFAMSGMYGSPLALALPFVLLSFSSLIEKKHLTAIILYALSMLCAKETIYLYPIYLVYYGFLFVRAIVLYAKYRKNIGDNGADKPADSDLIYNLPLYAVGAFVLQYVVSLPLIVKDYNANPFKFIYRAFLKPLVTPEYFSYNGLSIYNIFGKNAEAINVTFPSVAFTVCFGVLIFAIVAVVYFSKKNRAVLPLLGAYVLFTIASYFPDSTPVSIIPVLALLLASFVYTKDRRLLQIFSATSLALVPNLLTAMAYGGYFNMLALGEFTSSSYTGVSTLTSGAGLVISIICSIISVAAHLYFTFAAFDITMSNNRKLLTGKNDIGYFKGIARLFGQE